MKLALVSHQEQSFRRLCKRPYFEEIEQLASLFSKPLDIKDDQCNPKLTGLKGFISKFLDLLA